MDRFKFHREEKKFQQIFFFLPMRFEQLHANVILIYFVMSRKHLNSIQNAKSRYRKIQEKIQHMPSLGPGAWPAPHGPRIACFAECMVVHACGCTHGTWELIQFSSNSRIEAQRNTWAGLDGFELVWTLLSTQFESIESCQNSLRYKDMFMGCT